MFFDPESTLRNSFRLFIPHHCLHDSIGQTRLQLRPTTEQRIIDFGNSNQTLFYRIREKIEKIGVGH